MVGYETWTKGAPTCGSEDLLEMMRIDVEWPEPQSHVLVVVSNPSLQRKLEELTLVLRVTLVDAGASYQDRVNDCEYTLAAYPLALVVNDSRIV